MTEEEEEEELGILVVGFSFGEISQINLCQITGALDQIANFLAPRLHSFYNSDWRKSGTFGF